MRVFTATFDGHWPVGTAAVVIAFSMREAVPLLVQELQRRGLEGKGVEMKEVGMSEPPRAIILCDGNY